MFQVLKRLQPSIAAIEYILLIPFIFFIGWLIYQASLETDDRLQQAYYTATIAVCVAAVNNIIQGIRLSKSLKIQVEQSRRTDERQQAEWSRNDDIAHDTRREFCANIRKLLLAQQYDFQDEYRTRYEALQKRNSSAASFIIGQEAFNGIFNSLPVFEPIINMLGAKVSELPIALVTETINISFRHKTSMQRLQNNYNAGEVTFKNLGEYYREFRTISVHHMAKLAQYPKFLDYSQTSLTDEKFNEIVKHIFEEALLDDFIEESPPWVSTAH